MNEQPCTREGDSRAISGPTAHATRGRAAAPRLLGGIPAQWLPIASKLGGGLLAALVLAIVGWGAHPRAAGSGSGGDQPSLQSSLLAPSDPSVLSAGVQIALEAGTAVAPSASSDAAIERAAAAAISAAAPSSAVLPDGRVILNLASVEDLRRLPGIGPTRARAIIELRQRLAKFRAVEDLMRVKGIGRKIIQRIKPGVVLDRPADGSGGPSKSA